MLLVLLLYNSLEIATILHSTFACGELTVQTDFVHIPFVFQKDLAKKLIMPILTSTLLHCVIRGKFLCTLKEIEGSIRDKHFRFNEDYLTFDRVTLSLDKLIPGDVP